MGHKVNPIGFRLGISRGWDSRWFGSKTGYRSMVDEDVRIRQLLTTRYRDAGLSKIEIERSSNQLTVAIYPSRPGIVIGRGGQRVEETRQSLEKATGKVVRLNI